MADTLNLLTLAGAVQGVFFGLVLLQLQRGNRIANRFLAVFLLVFSVYIAGVVGYFSHWVLQYPYLGALHTPLGAIIGIPLMLYFMAVTGKNFRMRAWHWALFSPALVVFLWLLPFFLLSSEEKRQFLENSYSVYPESWTQIFLFGTLVNTATLVASYILIARHERRIREVYSTLHNKTLAWIKQFFYAGLAIFISCVLSSFWDITWADTMSNFCFCIVIYVFAYRAIRQPEIFADVRAETMPDTESLALIHSTKKYEKSALTEARAEGLLQKLEALMQTEKIYLDPNLNLQQLADNLGVSPHLTSQLLNQFKGESFSDFVNRYRVEHFKTAIQDPALSHLSVLGVAFESGFNSKAAFNAVFKKFTGQTPSELRRNAI